jgi:hypothetical protein
MSRVRVRLAKILSEALTRERGQPVTVDPDDLHPAKGYYRTGNGDHFRWEGFARLGGVRITLDSYVPMTTLVKSGVILVRERPVEYEVFEKEAP